VQEPGNLLSLLQASETSRTATVSAVSAVLRLPSTVNGELHFSDADSSAQSGSGGVQLTATCAYRSARAGASTAPRQRMSSAAGDPGNRPVPWCTSAVPYSRQSRSLAIKPRLITIDNSQLSKVIHKPWPRLRARHASGLMAIAEPGQLRAGAGRGLARPGRPEEEGLRPSGRPREAMTSPRWGLRPGPPGAVARPIDIVAPRM
jgi:hypothetical protein